MSDAHHPFLVVASTNTSTWIPCLDYFNYETCFLPMWSPTLHSCTIGPFHPSASRAVGILLLDDCVLVMSFVTIHKATTFVGIHPHHMLCSLYHLLWATHRVVPHRARGGGLWIDVCGYVGMFAYLMQLSCHVLALSCMFTNKPSMLWSPYCTFPKTTLGTRKHLDACNSWLAPTTTVPAWAIGHSSAQ